MASQMEIIDLISKPAYCPPPAPDLSIMVRIHPTKTQKQQIKQNLISIMNTLTHYPAKSYLDKHGQNQEQDLSVRFSHLRRIFWGEMK